MGLLNDLETQWARLIPAQLPAIRRQTLDD